MGEADITVRRLPGLAELATSRVSTPSAQAIDAFVATAGPQVAKDFEERRELATSDDVEESVGEAWGWLKDYFAPEFHTPVGTEDAELELAGYWMTVPNIEGASLKLTVEHSEQQHSASTLTILGIGGGPGFSLDVKRALDLSTSTNRHAVLSTMATFERIEVRRGGKVIGSYPRLVALNPTGTTWTDKRADPPSPDGSMIESESYNLTDSERDATVRLGLSAGSAWTAKAGIELEKLGLKAELCSTITYQLAVTYEYNLPRPHIYQWSRFDGSLIYYWS